MISSFNYNFNRLFISDRALGGYDVVVDENPTNPIGDLRQALTAAGSPVVSQIEGVGLSSIVASGSTLICQRSPGAKCQPGPGDDFKEYEVRGEDAGFFASANVALQSRAKGFADDKAVWSKVANDPSYAIIDAFALPANGDIGASGFQLKGIDAGSKEFEPVVLAVRDPVSGGSRDVTVIGIIELGSSASYSGLHVEQQTLLDVFGKPERHRYFVKTKAGANNKAVAREIESALLTTGAQAESLRAQMDKQNAVNQGFFYLMQGFMGLGLFVGVAAVGVIAFRTVVERRQQIGMLRALGYTRAMVGLTFMIESAFIAFMGLLSGIVFALILARQLITDQLANQGGLSFSVPWVHVLVIGVVAFGFALLMTLIPSRQAAGIPIAEALRYE
jgi:putative ABC transport system permease protein